MFFFYWWFHLTELATTLPIISRPPQFPALPLAPLTWINTCVTPPTPLARTARISSPHRLCHGARISTRIPHGFCTNFARIFPTYYLYSGICTKNGRIFSKRPQKPVCKMHFSCTALAVGEAQRAPHRHRHCEAMQTNETSCECVALAWKGQGALSLRPILQTQMAPDTPRALLARRHLSPSLGTPPRHLFCFRRLTRRSPWSSSNHRPRIQNDWFQKQMQNSKITYTQKKLVETNSLKNKKIKKTFYCF